ncbi:3813_t:CDS:2 [Racocetra fulgida]|uniref:3813_t:CDS:1 n=1 Tax=Racocetra fulgida TaxID=60492 RepID=A0A9N9AGE6_9GLOM|nr:3813_t:CDS:2 [Racocetra fulgida]
MASSGQTSEITNNLGKRCFHCDKYKNYADFTCQIGSKMKIKKKSKAVSYDDNKSDSTIIKDMTDDDCVEAIIVDKEDGAWFNLKDLENLVSNCFENTDENDQVNFSGTFKFDDELIDYLSSKNQESDEEKIYHNIAEFLLLPIESGSHYYWELRKIYVHKKNNQLVGEATVHLGCVQREDLKRSRPDSKIVKKIVEARAPIERYSCGESIKLNIDINKCQTKISIEHLITHSYPTHRENNLPQDAIAWISRNTNRSHKKIDLYRMLGAEGLIDPNIHTYQQVL